MCAPRALAYERASAPLSALNCVCIHTHTHTHTQHTHRCCERHGVCINPGKHSSTHMTTLLHVRLRTYTLTHICTRMRMPTHRGLSFCVCGSRDMQPRLRQWRDQASHTETNLTIKAPDLLIHTTIRYPQSRVNFNENRSLHSKQEQTTANQMARRKITGCSCRTWLSGCRLFAW